VPADSELMKAWNAYHETEDFKNSFAWVTATNAASGPSSRRSARRQ